MDGLCGKFAGTHRGDDGCSTGDCVAACVDAFLGGGAVIVDDDTAVAVDIKTGCGVLDQRVGGGTDSHNDCVDIDHEFASLNGDRSLYDYFTDTVIEQVYQDLKKYKNLSSEEAYKLLYQGGLKIYTTMDPKVQASVEKAAWNNDIWPDYKLDSEGNRLENQIEGAIVVMNYDGEVVGIANGIREKTASLSLLRGYTSARQTGSSMKPVAVYAPAIELKKIHFSSLFRDIATETVNGRKWPTNFSNTYGTPITVYKAVAKSLNTIAVQTMQLIGVDFAFDFLTQSLGFTTLVDGRWDDAQGITLTDRTLSTALGGLTDGCTVTEMCAAYASFGNLGVYKSPRFYTLIEDYTGDVVLDKNKVAQTNQAMSPQRYDNTMNAYRKAVRDRYRFFSFGDAMLII